MVNYNEFQYKFTVVYCESVNLLALTLLYLLHSITKQCARSDWLIQHLLFTVAFYPLMKRQQPRNVWKF